MDMTNFTPIGNGQDADATTFNGPLTELDAEIEDIKDGTSAMASPAVTSFANAAHDHEDAAGGAQITAAAIDSTGASDGYVLTADGAGVAAFEALPAVVAPPYIHIQDQKPAGTHGGTFTFGAWQPRNLNTEVTDTDGLASVAANQITLAAGTYECHITAPARTVNQHKAKLRDTTGATDLIIGTSEYTSVTAVMSKSVITGRFTIGIQSVLEVQHRCALTGATVGYGTASNFSVIEVYTDAQFWKVG